MDAVEPRIRELLRPVNSLASKITYRRITYAQPQTARQGEVAISA